MKKEMANTRGAKYGNSSYAILSSEFWGGNIPMTPVPDNLPLPFVTAGEEDFFVTEKAQDEDTFWSVIRLTKSGYLRVTLKTTVFTNAGTVDLQISKRNDNSFISRRHVKTDDYVELDFEAVVSVDDAIVINKKSSIVGALLEYIAIDGAFQPQPAYIMNLELIQSNIGNVFYSIDPYLEINVGGCIKLDQVRQLLIVDYPILYEKIKTTPYMVAGSDVDGIYFSIIDFTQYPYLRAGATLSTLVQNLPKPNLTTSSVSTENASHSHSLTVNNVDEAGVNHEIGRFSYRAKNAGFYAESHDGCFRQGSYTNKDNSFVTEAYDEYPNNITIMDMPLVTVSGNTNSANATHTHTVATTVDTDNSYTDETNVRPDTSQMYAYMYSDK